MKRIWVSLSLVVMAVVAGCSTSSKPISVMLSFTSPQSIDYGQTLTLTATLTNDSKNGGVTWTITGAGTLSAQTTTSATYNPPAPGGVPANTSAMVTATSVSDPTKSFTITINVTPSPMITNASSTFTAAVEGTAYTAMVTETGGAGTLSYSVSVGSLPAGLSLNSSTGAITGTATGPSGPVTFTVQIKDSSASTPETNTKSFTITINEPPPPVITPASLSSGVEGTVYSQTIAETGGLAPFTFSKSAGAFPAGINISNAGVISGTPTGPNGTANFTIKVVDSSNPPQSATQAFSIVVNLPAAPKITTTTLPADVEGTAYNQTVAASGFGTLSYAISAGALPAPLKLNAATGAITGTPTGPNGTASFTVTVTDSSNPPQSVSQSLSIAINLPPAPKITTTTLPGGTEFVAYNQAVAATGYGTLSYAVTAGALPAGVGPINSSTGAITGTPTGPNGTASFTVTVTDGSNPTQSVSQALSIAVSLPAAPAITTSSLPNATVGGVYNQSIAFTGGHGPFTWSISAGALPGGFSINPSTGAITSGSVPNAVGTTGFTVQVVDSSNPAQSATKALSISIVTAPLAIATGALPTGAVGDVYPSTSVATFASGGVPPYTFTVTTAAATFPAGLNLSSAGQITGTPTSASGSPFNFTVQVKDSTNAVASNNFSIAINAALAVTTTSLPAGTQGQTYPSTSLVATGGITPYTWTITAGALPAGMSQTGTGGNTISGIPTASGTFPVTFKVTDAAGGMASSGSLNIVLAAAPALMVTTTNANLPAGTINVGYTTTNLSATGGIQPYTWSITSGALPTGMNPLTAGGQISGTPTATGTFNFTVKVTDSATPTQNTNTANLSIVVNALTTTCDFTLTGKESLLSGPYAFTAGGFDASGNPAYIGGVLTASGAAGANNLTAGTMDMNLNAGVTANLTFMSGSKYNLGQDANGGYRGCLTFVTSAGTQHYAFSVDAIGGNTAGVAANGFLVNFDTTGPYTSGILRQATASAFTASTFTGNWAFGVSGPQNILNCNNSVCGGEFAAAGVFTFSGSTVSGVVDFNNNGQLDGNSALTSFPASAAGGTLNSGPFTISANGRGTLDFTPSGSVSAVTNFVYVVSATEVLVLNSDNQQSNSAFIGRSFKQTGTFTTLTGNHVIYSTGVSTSTSGGNRTELDLVNTTSPNFTFSGYQNDGGNLSDPTTNSGSGTYAVASNGRVTLTCTGCGGRLPIFYMFGPNNGFFLSSDGAAAFGGFEPQTGSSFSETSISGVYELGTIHPDVSGIGLSSGDVLFTPGTSMAQPITDNNSQGTLTPGNVGGNTYSVDSTGAVFIPSGCSVAGGTCSNLLLIISPTRAVVMKTKPAPGSITSTVQVLQQ